ncbi:LUD domain-containing protein [Halosimplex salinum]|uniref:LUD domain-containing protein n=1 Tax=Halosimplex salinum TaxID=1710538 RepID=UPI000F49D987|nr:LUD domain-containing protein [Halosimplex salinum]
MPPGSADSLSQDLEAAGVRTRRVRPAAFAETIDDLAAGPAVGVELTDLPVSLADAPVSVDPTPAELRAATVGVTPASLSVAGYGSLVLPGTADGAELVSLFVEHHVAVLRESDVVHDMEAAFDEFDADAETAAESRILATGPSATADMGALVEGAHGPKTVTAVVLEGE